MCFLIVKCKVEERQRKMGGTAERERERERERVYFIITNLYYIC